MPIYRHSSFAGWNVWAALGIAVAAFPLLRADDSPPAPQQTPVRQEVSDLLKAEADVTAVPKDLSKPAPRVSQIDANAAATPPDEATAPDVVQMDPYIVHNQQQPDIVTTRPETAAHKFLRTGLIYAKETPKEDFHVDLQGKLTQDTALSPYSGVPIGGYFGFYNAGPRNLSKAEVAFHFDFLNW